MKRAMEVPDVTPNGREPHVSLTHLPAGAFARLSETRVDPDTRDLLRALGLTDASRLQVCKTGDPFIIQVRATRLGLSHAVAEGILVVPDDAQDAR